MKLWKIYQDKNDDYDTYDSAIVAADTAEEARKVHPGGYSSDNFGAYSVWVSSEHVGVIEIGEALPSVEPGVVLASFNAG